MLKIFFKKMQGGGLSPARKPFTKILWSWLGAFIGIYLVSIVSELSQVNVLNSLFLVGSFGASAVLIYGAPDADFSQPRNLLGGHIISAFIGVSIFKFFPLDVTILGALAVSFSIVAMHFTRTLHPPGGATALIAVIGSSELHNTGYMFVVTPIATGAIILLIIALFINNLSNNTKRHYPKYWL
ncbi:HPP family protein [Colwellia sp. MB02u-10]|uniref:HPP family protein n=1 Tax=Colwellia sp. MB02u-10 TaxID=2759828 RepID=UPI0015F4DA3E|nr:HPP family protein [Colwellia sp. MB02u-10]MBA6342521.1 HPP family protein [Colwellia sp. MB02u-10]